MTLLRSLNPVLVVDQICKALAYFGGYQGLHHLPTARSPASAQANGSGGLFVGWISEIFPKLESGGFALEAAPALPPKNFEPTSWPEPPRHWTCSVAKARTRESGGRGRPKGSGTKAKGPEG